MLKPVLLFVHIPLARGLDGQHVTGDRDIDVLRINPWQIKPHYQAAVLEEGVNRRARWPVSPKNWSNRLSISRKNRFANHGDRGSGTQGRSSFSIPLHLLLSMWASLTWLTSPIRKIIQVWSLARGPS